MAVILPQSIGGTASGWEVADYLTVQRRSEPAVAGLATIELVQLADVEMWLVDHAVVACDSAGPTQLRWYEDRVSDLTLLDGTSKGNFDVADWPAGLQLRPTHALVAQWAGCSDGSRGILTLQARVLRRI